MDQRLIASFLDKGNVFAVVGASRDPEKYGHQVYRDLRGAGYNVYPVNPHADEILGSKCYPHLEALPEKPDVVDLVVPPRVTEETVKTCKKLGIAKVWMQPGSESQKSIRFCRENEIDVVHGVCVMAQRRKQEQT
ncbi:CoA-binding protein [Candidatus Bathyarchaeota archaeon]|nr:CoA-binding protein [Candidatus Bathyarchaeota archaeon]